MVADKKIAWPAQLAIGADGMVTRLTISAKSWAHQWSL